MTVLGWFVGLGYEAIVRKNGEALVWFVVSEIVLIAGLLLSESRGTGAPCEEVCATPWSRSGSRNGAANATTAGNEISSVSKHRPTAPVRP